LGITSTMQLADVIGCETEPLRQWLEQRRGLDVAFRFLSHRKLFLREAIRCTESRVDADALNTLCNVANEFADSLRSWADAIESEKYLPTPILGGRPPLSPTPHIAKEFEDLIPFARDNLKGIERRIIELLCERRGECKLSDLAGDAGIGWNAPYDDAWNSARKRINRKLKRDGLSWRLSRSDNAARLTRIGRK